MKINEVFDEFQKQPYENRDELVKQWFRYQLACASNAYKYFMFLQDKYKDTTLTVATLHGYQTNSYEQFAKPENYFKHVADLNILTPAELKKLERLFVRMVNAKKNFEDISGDSTRHYSRTVGLVENSDEFTKRTFALHNEYIANLYKHQAACSRDVWNYIHYLQSKHDGLFISSEDAKEFQVRNAGSTVHPRSFIQHMHATEKLTPEDLDILEYKYTKMYDAKIKFEEESGTTVHLFALNKGYTLRLGESNEFKKQTHTKHSKLVYAFRHQLACCRDFSRYDEYLHSKYPEWEGSYEMMDLLKLRPVSGFTRPDAFIDNVAYMCQSILNGELEKLHDKYVRMLKAKQQYEDAGGVIMKHRRFSRYKPLLKF